MLAFIHIEKTAGQTIKWILRSSFGVHHCDVEPWSKHPPSYAFSPGDLERVSRFYPRLASIAGHHVTPYAGLEVACSDLIYFAFLRNPIKQVASYYQYLCHKHRETRPFERWIEQEWPRNMQTKRLVGKVDSEAAIQIINEKNIFVGLVKNFDESIFLLKSLRCSRLDIGYKRRNVTPDNSLAQQLLSQETTRQMIVEATMADRKLYEYLETILYPSYQKEYGSNLKKDVDAVFSTTQVYNRRKIFFNRLYRNSVFKSALWLYRTHQG